MVKRIIQSKASGGTEQDEIFLHSGTIPVENLSAEIFNIIQDLRDTLWAYAFCLGLSAPQIGSRYSLSVVNPSKDTPDDDLILINPKIITISGKKDRKRESCMSVWGKMGEVERRSKILLEYRDTDFNLKQIGFTGFDARIVQHELDHLQGILYSDKLYNDSILHEADFFKQHEIAYSKNKEVIN